MFNLFSCSSYVMQVCPLVSMWSYQLGVLAFLRISNKGSGPFLTGLFFIGIRINCIIILLAHYTVYATQTHIQKNPLFTWDPTNILFGSQVPFQHFFLSPWNLK